MNISFSIIMPTFNRKDCIKDAIDSLLCQTYQSFELILIDDGSTDGTGEYLKNIYKKELADKKIVYIMLSNNKGAAFARNEGLKAAKNNWIGYLDTDNKMRTNFLSTFVFAIKNNPSSKIFYAKFKKLKSKQIVGYEFDLEELVRGNFIDLGVFVHSAGVYRQLGGFDSSLKRLIDWDLIIKYTEKYEPIFLCKVVLDYYDGSDFLRISDNNMHDENYKEIVLNYYKRLPADQFVEMNRRDLVREKIVLLEASRKLLIEKESEIVELIGKIKQKDNDIRLINNEIIAMKHSKFWKLRNMFARFGIIQFIHTSKKLPVVLRRDGLTMFIEKTWYYFYFKGHIPQQYPEYQKWIKNNEKVKVKDVGAEIEGFNYKPKISVIVPVYNVEPKWLNRAIVSVRDQYYENWELCIHDDASTKKETVDCLKQWQEKGDARIKISFGNKNQHISGASNDALKLATGEFVALLDNDDELAPFALYENVKILNEHKDADFIYSDEDKIDGRGKRWEPFFKPDWSPELMLSQMYTCHLGVYRKSIIDKIGGFRKGYEGAQDYDLVLRFTEHTKPEKIVHIPKVLYHWRAIEGSTAKLASEKDYASVAAQKALMDYLERNNLDGEVMDGPVPGFHRVRIEIKGNPLVSIIIPFRDHVEVLKTCVNSIIEKTDYDNYEIILVDNQSEEKETKEYLKELETNLRVKVLEYNKPFCYSAINNYAVDKAEGEYVLLLNNDTEVITGEWLRTMLEQAQKKGVGAVGAKLLYTNDRIQHAGIIMGMGIAGHAFKSFKDGEPNYFKHADIIKNYSGVTAACLMTKKSVYEELGGLNEKDLKIAYNDVDFCLRVLEAGYRIVYTPYAKLYHYESLSRGYDHELKKTNPKEYKRVVAEWDYMYKKWDKYIKNDPYYSPNLTRKHENFSIKTDFRK